MESTALSLTLPFSLLLRQTRKRAGMTQRDLAAALGYSDALISSLEKGQRQPDLETVIQRFVPALGPRWQRCRWPSARRNFPKRSRPGGR